MAEIFKIAVESIVQQPLNHVVSAATISAGVTEKIVKTDVVSAWDQTISAFGDAAVIIAPLFTLFLFYRAWKHDRLDTKLKLIKIANEGRREADK
jgi:hypothetical protein